MEVAKLMGNTLKHFFDLLVNMLKITVGLRNQKIGYFSKILVDYGIMFFFKVLTITILNSKNYIWEIRLFKQQENVLEFANVSDCRFGTEAFSKLKILNYRDSLQRSDRKL